MLIAYSPDDGSVVWTSGTNTTAPLGPPDEVAATVTGRDDLVLLRLHDVEDVDVVTQLLLLPARVINGRVIILPPPVTTPTPPDGGTPTPPAAPTIDDVLQMIQDLQAQSQRLQDQSDQLTLLIGGGL